MVKIIRQATHEYPPPHSCHTPPRGHTHKQNRHTHINPNPSSQKPHPQTTPTPPLSLHSPHRTWSMMRRTCCHCFARSQASMALAYVTGPGGAPKSDISSRRLTARDLSYFDPEVKPSQAKPGQARSSHSTRDSHIIERQHGGTAQHSAQRWHDSTIDKKKNVTVKQWQYEKIVLIMTTYSAFRDILYIAAC